MPLNPIMPGNMPFGNMGPIGVLGGPMNPMMNMQNKGMPPMMGGVGMQAPMMGGMPGASDPKAKLAQLIRDK